MQKDEMIAKRIFHWN